MNLSKSRYVVGKRCLKNLWLLINKPNEMREDNNDAILETGNKVGELARNIFGDLVTVKYNNDKSKMITETKNLMNSNNIVCEASFIYENNFCAVDILKIENDGVEIYEVKSSTDMHDYYLFDVSYQTWVLKKIGYNVKKSYIIYLNNQYIKHGDLDLNKLFVIKDVSNNIDLVDVETTINNIQELMTKSNEPIQDLFDNCNSKEFKPNVCPFFEYCTKDLPKPNVFDLGWRLLTKKKLELYHNGIIKYSDLLNSDVSDKVKTQIEHELYKQSPKIDKLFIDSFMNNLKYPLYFFDFESVQLAIPEIDGTRPYQQLCFQYSLHIMDENGRLIHKEFLSENYNGDFVREMCEQLIKDIPLNACTIVYNKSFEVPRLKEMANMYEDISEHLLNIANNIVDLADIFSNQSYYTKEMGGSYSIKKVLPALFPNEPELDYHSLDQVHKGDEASAAFLSLRDLGDEDRKKLRSNMLKYCCLDTYAMVKIYEKLKSI